MYHDQNKHTRFLPLTAYFVNTRDVCILPSTVPLSRSRRSQFLSWRDVAGPSERFLSQTVNSNILLSQPLGMESWGFSPFEHQRVQCQHLFSQSPILTNVYNFRASWNFVTKEKKCMILIAVYIPCTWVKINCSESSSCKLELHLLTWHTIFFTKK